MLCYNIIFKKLIKRRNKEKFDKVNKFRIFTGITPTGNLTIGHYFSIIKNLLNLQNNENYEILIMIADLHALTIVSDNQIDYKKKSKEIAEILYACGFNEEKCKIFIQSEITEHLELSYFLSSYCSIGRLENMIQYKEKAKKDNSSSFSLLYYPILMASDILLYDSDLIIVGKDQKQHLEFAKYIAGKFNKRNPELLKIPDFFIAKNGSKIMSLHDPSKKMSKSNSDNILILEDDNKIREKIMKAKTDSEGKIYFDRIKKPGVSNLLTIYSCLFNCKIDDAEKFFSEKSYSNLKEAIIEKLINKFSEIRKNIRFSPEEIDKKLLENNKFLKKISSEKLKVIKNKLSLWNL
ncbi:MAG TPA: tryptophan--tRNA ligase [Mycoplasmatales bacterium]|nr:tryptophan--tRNA ligase [Mycoplasmatales bacterium]